MSMKTNPCYMRLQPRAKPNIEKNTNHTEKEEPLAKIIYIKESPLIAEKINIWNYIGAFVLGYFIAKGKSKKSQINN